MCVRRIVCKSCTRKLCSCNSARKVSSEEVGPGSMSAFTPSDWLRTAAMDFGRPIQFTSSVAKGSEFLDVMKKVYRSCAVFASSRFVRSVRGPNAGRREFQQISVRVAEIKALPAALPFDGALDGDSVFGKSFSQAPSSSRETGKAT